MCDQAASRGDSDALLFLGLMIKAGEFVAPGDKCVMMRHVCDDVTCDICEFLAPDCDKSCMAFKQCAERGPWSHLLRQAFMAWNAGDMCEMM